MGQAYEATCLDCGHRFMASKGGGFTFNLIHCDTCGREKSIPLESKALLSGQPTLKRCRCGGTFASGAPPRCPKCRSAKLKRGRTTCFYD